MRILVLLLVAACGKSAPSPSAAPSAVPSAVPSPSATAPVASAPPAAVMPTCIPADASIASARSVDGAVVACYQVPQQGGDADHCWRFDPATRAWSFASQALHADVPPARPQVTVTATEASVCKPDGTDCKTVPISITARPDDSIEAATNADRSLIAVWAAGPVHVFDGAGKRLASIKPWHTSMAPDGEPSSFRAAHLLGDVLEVRIADTPITSAIRLYHARTGKKIADVSRGQPMDDTLAPVELGGTHYAFVTFDNRTIVVVDVATGKQLASYPIGGDVTPSLIARAGDGIVTIVETTAMLGSDGKVTTVSAPVCPG